MPDNGLSNVCHFYIHTARYIHVIYTTSFTYVIHTCSGGESLVPSLNQSQKCQQHASSIVYCTDCTTYTYLLHTLSATTIISCPAIKVSSRLILTCMQLFFVPLITCNFLIFFQINPKVSAVHTLTSSISQETTDREATKMIWISIAIVLIVVAVLLAITSIALGTIFCLTRKSVKSPSTSKPASYQGYPLLYRQIQNHEFDKINDLLYTRRN